MIYVIGSARGPKKVGLAAAPTQRLKSLQTGSTSALSVLYARGLPMALADAVERRAHWLLRNKQAHGEWFQVGLAAAKAAVDQAVAEGGEGEKTRSSVGRKPLGVKETKVRLPEGTPERIEALVGPNRMAVFIREAVEAELRRREKATKPKPD